MTEIESEKELTLQGLATHMEKQAREEALYHRVEELEERLTYVEGVLGYREAAQRAEQIAQRLMAAAAGKVADLEDEQIRAALLMLERRQSELGENVPF